MLPLFVTNPHFVKIGGKKFCYYLSIMDKISCPHLFSIICIIMTSLDTSALAAEDFVRERKNMIAEIQETVHYTSDYTRKKSLDDKVMSVMARVPRHEFIPKSLWKYAYENRPLPIGEGQTISQPYIVALMTDLAGINKDSIVLEVGTGSGYQAAVLAELAKHVYTIEIIEELGKKADQTLERLGFKNVSVRIGDGYNGWPEHAPFDAILVTAAPEIIPKPLIEQLKPGGRLVIPVGERYATQTLKVVEKNASGKLEEHDVLPVGFVPLTGDH